MAGRREQWVPPEPPPEPPPKPRNVPATLRIDDQGRVIVLASPGLVWPLGDSLDDSDSPHNCDEMGCGSTSHVIARFTIPT